MFLIFHFLSSAKVVDLRNKRRNLVSVCLEETGGLGVDCFLDNKGKPSYFQVIVQKR